MKKLLYIGFVFVSISLAQAQSLQEKLEELNKILQSLNVAGVGDNLAVPLAKQLDKVIQEARVVQKILKSPNVFYAIRNKELSGDFEKHWDDWQKEHEALLAAVAWWKERRNDIFREDQELVNAWLVQLERREDALNAEKKFFDKVAEMQQRYDSSSHQDLSGDIDKLKEALASCQKYLDEIGKGSVAQHHAEQVKKHQSQWQAVLERLEQLAKVTSEVKEAYQELAGVSPEELTQKMNSVLALIAGYQKKLEESGLSSYQDVQIASWQETLKARLVQVQFNNKLEELRAGYQKWKGQSSIDAELGALESFRESCNQYLQMLEGHPQADSYAKTVQPWVEEAKNRKKALQEEKRFVSSIDNAYQKWQQADNKVAPDEQLKVLRETLALCQQYQEQTQQGKISIHSQKSVSEKHKVLHDRQAVLQKEVDVFGQLRDARAKYSGQRYTLLADEKKALAGILTSAKEYQQLLEQKRIDGFHQEQVAEWTKKLQQRQNQVLEEEALFSLISAGFEKLNESEASLQSRQHALDRVLEHCKSYASKVGKDISQYHSDKVAAWQKTLTEQQQKIATEQKLFGEIEKLEKDYISQTTYPDWATEKQLLDRLVASCSSYLEQIAQKNISDAQQKQVKTWLQQNKSQRGRLTNEKSLFDALEKHLQQWQTTQWQDPAAESAAITAGLQQCQSYREQLIKPAISRYFHKQVTEYEDRCKQRQAQLDEEKALVKQIEDQLQQTQTAKHTSLEAEQKLLETLLSSCQKYEEQVKSGKSSQYSQQKIVALAKDIADKVEKYQQIAQIVRDFTTRYENWKNATRRLSLSLEEKELNEIEGLIAQYQQMISAHKVTDYNGDNIKAWSAEIVAQKQRLTKEQQLFEQIKEAAKTVEKDTYASGEEEQKKIGEVLALCKQYTDGIVQKEITGHSRRGIELRQRKLKERLDKIERELSTFQRVERAYQFWQKNKPWPEVKDEKRALEATLQQIKNYEEDLGLKKISSYKAKTVTEYEQEMRKRESELRNKS